MPGAAPSTGVGAAGRAPIAARTLRTDRWWLPPLVTALGLVAWVLYATVRAASQRYYLVADYHYLTPFSSPCVSTSLRARVQRTSARRSATSRRWCPTPS